MQRVLLLGGTTEASRLAQTLAAAHVDAVFSYAGRTDAPVAQPLPTRVGGFGGVDGLCQYLQAERITQCCVRPPNSFCVLEALVRSRRAMAAIGTAANG